MNRQMKVTLFVSEGTTKPPEFAQISMTEFAEASKQCSIHNQGLSNPARCDASRAANIRH